MSPTSTLLDPAEALELRAWAKQQATRKDASAHPFADRYWNDPAAWVRECIEWRAGESPAGYQLDILSNLVLYGRESDRGPRGLGKTSLDAWCILWFATTRDARGADWKAPTTAGSWSHLTRYLWPEIHKWARRLKWDVIGRAPFRDGLELLDLSLKLKTGTAFAAASDNPDYLEGAHADQLLYVFDEAKSIPESTWDAVEGAFSGAGTDTGRVALALATSTPGEPLGRFYDLQSGKRHGWHATVVTLEQALAAGRISQDWVDARLSDWGVDATLYQRQVLGNFASEDTEGVIPLAWVEAAMERWQVWADAGRHAADRPESIGVDVARSGGDKTVLAPRVGWTIIELRRTSREDTMQTAGRVVALQQQAASVWREPEAIVDVIGIGAGVVDRLRELGRKVRAFNASAKSALKDRSGEWGFANARAAAWWSLRELLEPTRGEPIALPPDDGLKGELVAPHWRVQSGGKILIESKADVIKRLGRSTDAADAVVMAFWNDERVVTPDQNDAAFARSLWGTDED